MSDATDLAAQAASPDPAAGLRAALALRRLAESLERLQVDNARRKGWSWQDIAAALEVSKQAVHKRYAATAPSPDLIKMPAAQQDSVHQSIESVEG
jgi:hypothetical protein